MGTDTVYSNLEAGSYSIVAYDDAGCISNTVTETLSDPPGILA